MFSYTKLMQAMVAAGVVTPTDPYFNLVTLLLPGNGTNGAQNNTFLDSSSNNFTITRNGNTTQGTFSPFSQTGWSNFFDGTGDFLRPASNIAFDFGTGDFTVEGWFFLSNANGNFQTIFNLGYSTANLIVRFGSTGSYSGLFQVSITTTSASVVYSCQNSSQSTLANGWHHFAFTRSSSTCRVFLDGVQQNLGTGTTPASFPNTSFADSTNITSTAAPYIGSNAAPDPFTGYISNLRVLKGTAQYTSGFTVPTSPLTAITNTSLLTCQSNRFIDNSSNALSITANGDASVQAFSPFLTNVAYTPTNQGGSGYFDGTGDYLSVADNVALNFGTGDFEISCWIYLTQLTGAGAENPIVGKGNNNVFFAVDSSQTLRLTQYAVGVKVSSSAVVPLNAWSYVVASRVSSTSKLFLNGVEVGSAADTSNYTSATALQVGQDPQNSGQKFYGYISGLRLVKGSGVTSVTLPTSPPTAITNTSLLTNFTNAGITDATAKNIFETVGNASISTAQSKFGGGSMFFDGTGDYLSATPKIQSNAMQGGNATIEMWVYSSNSSSSLKCLIDTRSGQGTDTGYGIYQIANNVVIYGNGVKGNAAGQLAGNTWTHLAVTRANTTNYVFIGGTLYNTFTYGNTLTSSNVTIASDVAGSNAFTGYIDDLRITNGYARYTANFTPTTTTFPLQ